MALLLVKHPLDPLIPKEIESTVKTVGSDEKFRNLPRKILEIRLVEPTKQQMANFIDSQTVGKFERKVNVVVADIKNKLLWQTVVNLGTSAIADQRSLVEHGQPSILADEFFQIEEAVKKSPLVKQALQARHITDTDLVMCDPWSVGAYDQDYEGDGTKRLAMGICFLKNDRMDNGYSHPIDGLIPIIDFHTMEVIHVDQIDTCAVVPQKCFNYFTRNTTDPLLKPIKLSQPDGPSFLVNGHSVKWYRWSFRIGFTSREGLVLHQLAYDKRPVLFRASLSEMVVPYGDPRPSHFRKNAFDVGDYGIGRCANSLKLGCDCFGEIHYFDAWLNDSSGNAVCIENAVCLHEEDDGILWKHTDWRYDKAASAKRSRRLVVSMIATVANYEYAFYWYLYLDGSIESEVKLTGIINTGAANDNESPKYGTIISPNLYAPVHEHFFCYRLDVTVDGPDNTVYRVDIESEPDGPENPYGNAYYPKSTLLKTDTQARGCLDARKSTYWKIVNPNKLNAVNQPVAYRLMPKGNAFPYASPSSSVMKRANFVKNHFWVTRFHQDQYFAAGNFPNQNGTGDGLEQWSSENQSIENTDIVVWYTMGMVHVPRCEDFPVMPVAKIGFMLIPDGFFTSNPTIDCSDGKIT